MARSELRRILSVPLIREGAAVLAFVGACADVTGSALPPGYMAPDAGTSSDAGPAPAEAALADAGGGAMDSSAPSDDGGGDDATTSTQLSAIRVANWSPVAPAVDFCFAIHATGSFQGPALGALAASLGDAGAAQTPGVAFPEASAYVYVTAGAYDVRLVAAGAFDCSVAIGPETTSLPPLAPGDFETLAVMGELGKSGSLFTVATFADDGLGPPVPSADGGSEAGGEADDGGDDDAEGGETVTTPVTAPVAVRFIHAAPGLPQVNVTALASGLDFTGVTFGMVTSTANCISPTTTDPNGYVDVPPLVATPLSVYEIGAAGIATLLIQTPVSLAGGAAITAVLVGDEGPDGGGTVPAQLLFCADSAAQSGVLGDCWVAGTAQ